MKKKTIWSLGTGTGVGGIGYRYGNLRLCRHTRTNGACY